MEADIGLGRGVSAGPGWRRATGSSVEATCDVGRGLATSSPPAAATASASFMVHAPRGFAVPEHPEPLNISVDAELDATPIVRLDAVGADVDLGTPTKTCSERSCRFVWRARATVRAPTTLRTVDRKRLA